MVGPRHPWHLLVIKFAQRLQPNSQAGIAASLAVLPLPSSTYVLLRPIGRCTMGARLLYGGC